MSNFLVQYDAYYETWTVDPTDQPPSEWDIVGTYTKGDTEWPTQAIVIAALDADDALWLAKNTYEAHEESA